MLEDITSHIGILFVSLHIPAAQSLKDKRRVLKSLKDRIRSQFNVSVAELDGQDKWQTATLGLVAINHDQKYLDQSLQSILSFIDQGGEYHVCEHQIQFL